MHGLPDDKIVFGAFNQSYKIDRGSFSVWMRVLAEVPDSVLWLLGQSPTAIANLSRHAQLAGIATERLIFAPFAQPHDHLTRLRLATPSWTPWSATGTPSTPSDALWAGVPVITSRGKHFASRVSESLLNAMELPELVGADHDDMIRIAKRVGTDADYRTRPAREGRSQPPEFAPVRYRALYTQLRDRHRVDGRTISQRCGTGTYRCAGRRTGGRVASCRDARRRGETTLADGLPGLSLVR